MTVLMGFVARPLATVREPRTIDREPSRLRRRGLVRLTVRVITLLLTGVVILRACARLPVSAASAPSVAGQTDDMSAAADAPSLALPFSGPLPAGWQVTVGDLYHPLVARRVVNVGLAGVDVTLLRFDSRSTRLQLHPVDGDPGSQKRMRAVIDGPERLDVVAAFSGGFKLGDNAGGMSVGRFQTGPLKPGLASVVTYADRGTDIGSWGTEVPAVGRSVVSVRQNLHLLIDKGLLANDLADKSHWGATFGGSLSVARSALGIDKDGNLIWAGSPEATPHGIAEALASVGVQRALELDINPAWVGAFTFIGDRQKATMLGQQLPPGSFLVPRQRDFFSVETH